MSKAYYNTAIIFILLTLTGCPGSVDSFTRKELVNGYVFYEEGGLPLICRDSPDRRCIPSVIKDYDFDTNFIIAAQYEYQLTNLEVDQYSIEQQFEVILEKGILRYWIIDCISDSIYGPLKWNEFLNKRKELGVPYELKIKK